MELLDVALVIASKSWSRKSDIVRVALGELGQHASDPAVWRSALRAVDRLVAVGFMRSRSLGVYEPETAGIAAVAAMTTTLYRVAALAQRCST